MPRPQYVSDGGRAGSKTIYNRFTAYIGDCLVDFNRPSGMHKIISVMSSRNKAVINELVKLIHDVLKNTMYNITLFVASSNTHNIMSYKS